MPEGQPEYPAPPPPPDPDSTIVIPAHHESSADALHDYLLTWGLENSDITAIPLFITRRLNEDRPRPSPTEPFGDL